MPGLEELKRKLKKEHEETYEVEEDSDFPVHERWTKPKKIKKIKK